MSFRFPLAVEFPPILRDTREVPILQNSPPSSYFHISVLQQLVEAGFTVIREIMIDVTILILRHFTGNATNASLLIRVRVFSALRDPCLEYH